jgi:site-specific DNA recombinase
VDSALPGPEQFRAWVACGGLSGSGDYRPGVESPALMSSGEGPSPRGLVPVAWIGRTSTEDQQDPVGSLLRQLRVSQAALPAGCVVVAHFYDVESGRKDLDDRGRVDPNAGGLSIPIPRDGGIQDLLAEAVDPGCRFVAVICEQIDRIARRTYYGTLVEHRLQGAGVTLWAADERITPLPGGTGMAAVIDPTNILTRRVKQGIAEWYALDMIKRARDGYETHTDQGYTVGKAPYGYRPIRIVLDSHADSDTAGHRGKGRSGPRTKTRLASDPLEADVVRRIFRLRVGERLGYQAIADRLNTDLVLNPPPTPPMPGR